MEAKIRWLSHERKEHLSLIGRLEERLSTTEMSLALLQGQVTKMGARAEEVDLSREEDEGGVGGPLQDLELDFGLAGEEALRELLVGLQGEREWVTSGEHTLTGLYSLDFDV